MPWPLLLLLPGLAQPQGLVQVPEFSLSSPSSCPDLLSSVFPNSLPLGAEDNTSVTFTHVPEAVTLDSCVQHCCSSLACSAAYLNTNTTTNTSSCWGLSCSADQPCLPGPRPPGQGLTSRLVLVRPEHPPWPLATSPPPTSPHPAVCEVGTEQCSSDEVCTPLNDKSRNGVCRCKTGFTRDEGTAACWTATLAPTEPPPFAISVAVASKTVQLPEDSASLTAYTVPEEDTENPFKYEWKLISSPSSEQTHATEEGAKTQSLTLAHLTQGVYVWKVIVTKDKPPGYGETRANVTVLAAKRINTPPKAVIAPPTQTVNLPTNKAIVDGSGSTDDSGRVALYTWVLDGGPVGYQPDLPSLPTLSLNNLTAGNYTIRLTVTDEDGATDTTTAMLVVVPDTDYKPKANAGEDKIIFLPLNTVTLNGNMSSDDHSIKTWEWTKEKGADGKELPADISGARSPYMTASNMEEGTYNFLLRVTDEAGQSGEDRVAVYVKPPTNLPPVAIAGPDLTLSLPLEFVPLDGSGSHDDGHIASFLWEVETSPPARRPNLSNDTTAVTNVTNLTEGKYVFRLTVTDNSGNTHSDTTSLLVQHDSNLPPAADPGQDRRVRLPVDSLVLDGRASSDDLGVERWAWARGAASPAAGWVVGGNMTSPTLGLAGLVPGTYTWHLTVWDKSEEKDTKAVKVTVLPDPDINSEVEIILNKDLSHLTENDKDAVIKRVEVMTKSTGTIKVGQVHILGDLFTKRSTIRFKVFSTSAGAAVVLPGPEVVAQLRRELAADPELLSQPVMVVQTRVCQNSCGGHGTCDQASRRCICQPAWMEDLASAWLWGGDSNCAWSVVYVCVIGGGCLAAGALLCCLASCRRKQTVPRSLRRYSRLQTSDPGLELQSDGASLVQTDETDDSEEEIVFQSAKKARRLNGSVPNGTSPQSQYTNGKPGFIKHA